MEPLPPVQSVPPAQPAAVILAKHRSLVGGIAIALGAALSITAGFLLFSNYFPTGEEVVPTVSPAPDSMAGWKTYTNTQYGFEFRYPKEYGVTTHSGNGFPQIFAIPLGSFETDKIAGLNVNVMTTKQFGDNYGEATVTAYSIAPIAGQKTFELIKSPEMGSSYRVSYFQFQEGYLVFSRDLKNPTADQILSTFKFIEPTAAVPANWKTCKNTAYGYEFRYPQEWNVFKRGAGEATPASCGDSSTRLLLFSRSIAEFSVDFLAVEVKNQEYVNAFYPNLKNLDDYLQKNTTLGTAHSKNAVEATFIIDGEPIVRFTNNDFVSIHKGVIYEFRRVGGLPLVDQILSTFKFIEPTVCTADAMRCPDGSYVGRTGPNCQFVCP